MSAGVADLAVALKDCGEKELLEGWNALLVIVYLMNQILPRLLPLSSLVKLE